MKRLPSAVAIALAFATVQLPTSAQKKDAAKPAAAAKPDVAADINSPQRDARKVTFKTREGTWMSVDVSPDGKTVLFDLLGDLYTLPIEGGAAQALTRGPAWDFHPRLSPDGRTVAFTSDENGMENLWLIDVDGKNRRALTDGKDTFVRGAAWTADGNYLIARKEDGKRGGIPPVEMWMYHRNGGTGIKLTSSDDMSNASGPVASRDGRFIYFAARDARFSYEPDLRGGLWAIMRLDRNTGARVPLTTGFGGAARPALSPDGKTLTFISRRDADTVLVARTLDSGSERILAKGLSRDEQEGFGALDVWPNYSFTPDGGSLVFSNHGKLTRLDMTTLSTRDIPFTATVDMTLAPLVAWQDKLDNGPLTARILRWPTQSPDGRWIAFDAFGKIWLQELAGDKATGQPRRLTSDAAGLPSREYAPAFSPDGRWLAYVTWTDAGGGHVWKAPLPSGPSIQLPAPAPVQLTRTAGHYANPAWSNKGDRLAVVRGSGLEFRGQQPEEESFLDRKSVV